MKGAPVRHGLFAELLEKEAVVVIAEKAGRAIIAPRDQVQGNPRDENAGASWHRQVEMNGKNETISSGRSRNVISIYQMVERVEENVVCPLFRFSSQRVPLR
ncbi:hypothetical protein [Aromatoleum sp.]|uniref:hypothetical protein n=1 Tax=Aromatoleum sp. TaxID=2307007 RepID=UPI002FCAF560